MNDYAHWLDEQEYKKAIGQLKLQLNGVFEPFKVHGLDVFIPGAIKETIYLAEQFGKRVRGRDVPIIRR